MKPDIESLKDVLSKYDSERYRLSKLIRDIEEIPKIKACVGKYYKCKNSNAAASSLRWIYYYIKEYEKESLIADSFEEENYYNAKVLINFDKKEYASTFCHPNFIEISKEEYLKAVKAVLHKIKKKFKC
jgi:hypothetical protein